MTTTFFAYGGDGTVNQVAMSDVNAKGQHSIVVSFRGYGNVMAGENWYNPMIPSRLLSRSLQ